MRHLPLHGCLSSKTMGISIFIKGLTINAVQREFTLLHISISAAHPELENLHHSLDIWHKAKSLLRICTKHPKTKMQKKSNPGLKV